MQQTEDGAEEEAAEEADEVEPAAEWLLDAAEDLAAFAMLAAASFACCSAAASASFLLTHWLHTRLPFFLSCAPLNAEVARSRQHELHAFVAGSSSTVTADPVGARTALGAYVVGCAPLLLLASASDSTVMAALPSESDAPSLVVHVERVLHAHGAAMRRAVGGETGESKSQR